MSKNLMWLIVAALCISLGNSQAAETKIEEQRKIEDKSKMDPYRVSFGVQGGLSFANASLGSSSVSGNRTGFTAGAFAQTALLPGFLYLQPELNFVQKGAENSQFGALATSRLNYIEVPVLVKVRFIIPKIRPFGFAGPSAAYLLSSSTEGAGVASNVERFNRIDLSAVIGAGFGFQLSDAIDSPEMTVSVRYSTGLNNIDSTGGQWKSNFLGVVAGVQF